MGGVLVLLMGGRSEAVRELVRDIVSRSRLCSRSFSSRSMTSCSRPETSTGLAAPKGLERDDADTEDVGPIFGEDKGLGVPEALPERGKSSNLRRICGVGGVELVGEVLLLLSDLDFRQSKSSPTGSRGGPMSPRPLALPNRLPVSSDALNLLPIVHESSRSAAPLDPSNPGSFLRLTGPSS